MAISERPLRLPIGDVSVDVVAPPRDRTTPRPSQDERRAYDDAVSEGWPDREMPSDRAA